MSDESGNTDGAEQAAPGMSELKSRLASTVGGLSDVGRVRELNEDNWFWDPLDEDLVLYAVADGMDGTADRRRRAGRTAVLTAHLRHTGSFWLRPRGQPPEPCQVGLSVPRR